MQSYIFEEVPPTEKSEVTYEISDESTMKTEAVQVPSEETGSRRSNQSTSGKFLL